jgi:hypothetical protein
MASRCILQFFTGIAVLSAAAPSAPKPDVVVHEWGTFTTVAGRDGRAVDWLPLGGRDDLPCFVEHFDDRAIGRIKGISGAALNAIPDYATARANLLGRVRMETPVLYFYANEPTRVNVRVDFPQGLMTEWYPKAVVAQRTMTTQSLRAANGTTWLRWDNVAIAPNTTPHFPKGAEPSHYYPARETDAAPLTVGTQAEKFLFYRGVANFDVPISTVGLGDTSVRVTNLGKSPLPVVMVFTNRGGKVGIRVERNVAGEVTIAAPAPGGSLSAVRRTLEAILVGEGLFAKEASAMVETWRDTWFEEGTRVFYLFPKSTVDEVLPLSVTPAPARTVRVFVGRMDVITPTMQRNVTAALRSNDVAVLASYGRVLGPIADRVLGETRDVAERGRIQRVLDAALVAQVRSGTSCP